MKSTINRCPVCQSELTVTRLHCRTCDTTIEGHFTNGPFAHLSAEQIEFIELFVRCEGKISRMEDEIGLSYPTIRNRLHEVIRAMGYEPGKDEPESLEVIEERRRKVLEDLDTGKISASDAMRILQGEGE